MSVGQVVEAFPEDLGARLCKLEHTMSLLWDKVGMADEAPLPPGKRRRREPEVTAPSGSRSSENTEEQLENALQALSQIQGGETASEQLQRLEEQLGFLSQCGSIAMQTLFAPQIEEAVLTQDLEMIRTCFQQAPKHGLISDGIQTWKGVTDYWKTIPDTKSYCRKMQKDIKALQDRWEYWLPFFLGFYKSNEGQSKQWEAEQKAEQAVRDRQWEQRQGQHAASSAANVGADADMANNTTAA